MDWLLLNPLSPAIGALVLLAGSYLGGYYLETKGRIMAILLSGPFILIGLTLIVRFVSLTLELYPQMGFYLVCIGKIYEWCVVLTTGFLGVWFGIGEGKKVQVKQEKEAALVLAHSNRK